MPDSRVGIFFMLSDAGPAVLAVLIVLLGFSVVSWAIIAFKFGYVNKSIKESREFLDCFFELSSVDKIFVESEKYRSSSLARVFRSAYIEYRALVERNGERHVEERVARAVKREVNAESKRLVYLVPFLATVGNTAPFIGLFGTVWGIMTSFQQIGLTQSASLASVAPGISEALVATAAGLVAAIPAVIAYNYFTQQIALIDRDLEDFSGEFVTACIRNIQKGSVS
ncbi:protein TolQ [Chlorobium phaeobacteroides]|jgi:biopolymer transport protein TolQ|uniref:Cell division and transport-associated protein TolQ n=1 Tax=Chlorobium phaeobacteroides (strain DSM 266 / SMG 266 / 2430) TaxID=290317 RepID=A1BET0_CHLPD|nr:protein TolQ [Chlorobium phaeobacteroides]ABL64907.1 Cell division and transport-associated protein TolQ [Chlorobium phaeobacteroides DSM 266]MBV5328623.1 protein TolQ [Chlorobium sp.]